MTTDYNDGEWHVWNGGECPVHERSAIHKMYANASRRDELLNFKGDAGDAYWASSFMFRVVTPYVEKPKPVDRWAVIDEKGRWITSYGHEFEARATAAAHPQCRVAYLWEVQK